MIVIGIDPGTRHLGWGVVRRDGTRPMHVAHGVIDTDTNAKVAEIPVGELPWGVAIR